MKRLAAGDSPTRPILGLVTEVYEHTKPDDPSNIDVDVQLRDGKKELPKVPVLPDRNGHADVPQVGDQVKVDFLAGPRKIPVVTERAYSAKTRAPLAREGHWRQEFAREAEESLYLEAEPADHSGGDPEVLRMGLKPDGLSDASTAVEIDRSTTPPTVRVQSETADVDVKTGSGDITVESADGSMTLSAPTITATDGSKSINLLEHTHDYDDATISDTGTGSGSKSTSTKTTDGPK
jgi:hypothetical protein